MTHARPGGAHRRRTRRLAAALLAAGVGTVACAGGISGRAPLEGPWLAVGLPAAPPTGATIEITLEREGDALAGAGSMTYPPGFASALEVRGIVSGSVLMLTFTSPALPQPMTMQAILTDRGGVFTGQLTLGQTGQQREFVRAP